MIKTTHFGHLIYILCAVFVVSCASSPFGSSPNSSNVITEVPQRIALLLPLHGPAGKSGQSVRDGFLNAYYQSHRQQTISFYDTSKTTSMAALYHQAVSEGANFVVGPLLKEDVENLNRSVSFNVPTLELNYSESSIPRNVYQFGLNPTDEAEQISDQAKSAGLSRALLIAPKTPWGERVSKAVLARWQSQGGTIAGTYYFIPRTNYNSSIAALLGVNTAADIAKSREKNTKEDLAAQRRQDFDVIFLLADPQSAREIVPLLKYYYADNIPMYATSSIYSGIANPAKDQDLNGVIYSDIPWIIRNKQSDRLFAVGRDAYLLSSLLPNVGGLNADTGVLSLKQQKIYRQISWSRVQNGQM